MYSLPINTAGLRNRVPEQILHHPHSLWQYVSLTSRCLDMTHQHSTVVVVQHVCHTLKEIWKRLWVFISFYHFVRALPMSFTGKGGKSPKTRPAPKPSALAWCYTLVFGAAQWHESICMVVYHQMDFSSGNYNNANTTGTNNPPQPSSSPPPSSQEPCELC